MAETQIYCHECRHTSWQSGNHSAVEPICPRCQSGFVEISEQPLRREPLVALEDVRLMEGFPGGELRDNGIPIPVNADLRTDGVGIVQQMLTALAGQGAQISVQGGQAGGLNIGDFSFGGMEAIMNQIMEQYQPQNQPTAQDTRNNLPRRKVPPSADTKASNVYAPGTTCKAGDPCTVCHTEFEAEGEVLQLPCEHCFHEGCILPWLELHHTCPICRAELPSEAGSAQGPVGTGPQGGNPHPQNDNAAPTIPTVEGLEAAIGDLARAVQWPQRQTGLDWLGDEPDLFTEPELFTDSDDSYEPTSESDVDEGQDHFRSPFNDTIREARGQTNEMSALRVPHAASTGIPLVHRRQAPAATPSNPAGAARPAGTDAQAGPSGTDAGPGPAARPRARAPRNAIDPVTFLRESRLHEQRQRESRLREQRQREREAPDKSLPAEDEQQNIPPGTPDRNDEPANRRGGLMGLVTAPVGILLRGFWQIGSAALRLLL